jgi:hypothetical protein
MRRLVIRLALAVLTTSAFVAKKATIPSGAMASTIQQLPLSTIDGSVNPEMISDYRAYSLLFRFISNRVGQDRSAIRAYLRQVFVDRSCTRCPAQSGEVDTQIDNLIAAGEEFYARAHPLDVRIKELLDQQSSATAEAGLASARQEKERICAEIIASFVTRLGPRGAENVRLHVR